MGRKVRLIIPVTAPPSLAAVSVSFPSSIERTARTRALCRTRVLLSILSGACGAGG
jgi:hypothetical protein